MHALKTGRASIILYEDQYPRNLDVEKGNGRLEGGGRVVARGLPVFFFLYLSLCAKGILLLLLLFSLLFCCQTDILCTWSSFHHP